MGFKRLALATAVAAAIITPVVTGQASVNAAAPEAGCEAPLFANAQRAKDVVKRDPMSLQRVAERNFMSVDRVRDLAKDSTLWLDPCGGAYFVHGAEEGPTPETTAAEQYPALVPLDQTFLLESKPGSQRTIYLDFDGHTVTGTVWNASTSYGLPDPYIPGPFSKDADPAFNADELTAIQQAWQVVAEDFAPFDVNVTTKDPGFDAIDRYAPEDPVYGTRVVFSDTDWCNCGGIAYLNAIELKAGWYSHARRQPAFVNTGPNSTGPTMGDTASHEVGHQFGLKHDGQIVTNADGTTTNVEYYAGSVPWVPIMGAGPHPITQWSKGEYANPTNTEDDLAIINLNAPYRADDFGNTAATATTLTKLAPKPGIIEKAGDVDTFKFTANGATAVKVTGPTVNANLDVRLTIKNAAGTVLGTINPVVAEVSSNTASGLDATWTGNLPVTAATYTAEVTDTGFGAAGAPGTYSNYGSLGHYKIEFNTGAAAFSATVATAAAGVVNRPYTASTPVKGTGGYPPYTYSATNLPGGLTIAPTTGTITGHPTTAGTKTVTVTVTDAYGAKVSKNVNIGVTVAALTWGTAATLPAATRGTPYALRIWSRDGTPAYAFSVTKSSFAGLAMTLNAGTTIPTSAMWLKGTPTTAGTYSFTAYITDGKGAKVSRTFTIVVK